MTERLLHRRSAVVFVILAINALVFIALEATGGSANRDNLIRFGAKYNELIARGEYWRLVTSIFLHIGFAHLLFNSLALYTFGTDLEKIYGAGKFSFIYLAAGIVGSLASYQFSASISAGASGAIFGLIGLSLVFGFRYRPVIPPRLKSRFGAGVMPVILYNVLYGLRPGSHIDNFAHLGGLAAGIVLGLIVPASLGATDDPLVQGPP